MAAAAQQLLERSLLTELQGIVARTLQGVDMFTQSQLADILGQSQRSHAQPAAQDGPQTSAQVLLFCSPT